MKKALLVLVTLALNVAVAIAAVTDKQTKDDIARHRAIATAHEAAAKCREAGTVEEVCNAQLQAACKGLAIGKFCGMKHQH